MKITSLFVLLACVAWQACAQEEEARPVSRALLKRGPPTRGKATTTTTTPAPQDDADYAEEEYPEEEQQEPSTEAAPSSTEGKKLVGSGVRPFRSNTDLLETLKRRRAQAAEAKLRAHSNSDAPPAPESGPVEPAKSSYSKKRFNSSPAKEATSEESSAPKQSTRGRFGKRPATRSIQAETEEEAPAAAPTPVRNGRTFARRGN